MRAISGTARTSPIDVLIEDGTQATIPSHIMGGIIITRPCGKLDSIQRRVLARSSGLTLGEGADECIAAEASRGNCDLNDLSTSTLSAAYNMQGKYRIAYYTYAHHVLEYEHVIARVDIRDSTLSHQPSPRDKRRPSLFPQAFRNEKPLPLIPQPKPEGRPRPTSGTSTPSIVVQQDMESVKPVPPLKVPLRARQLSPNPFPNLHPSQVRTGSPDTRPGAVPPSEQKRRGQARAQAQFAYVAPTREDWNWLPSSDPRISQQQQQQQQQKQRGPWQPSPSSTVGSSTQGHQWEPSPVSALSAQSYSSPSTTVPLVQARERNGRSGWGQTMAPEQQHQHQQQQQHQSYREPAQPSQYVRRKPLMTQQSRQQPVGHMASQSSLVAKRLGTDRAASLALNKAPMTTDQAQRWKRQSGRPSQDQGYPGFASASSSVAPPPPPKDPRAPSVMFVTSPTTAMAIGTSEPVGLPSTPRWLPHITPRKRGNDLFLDVR
ncbi:hypothetical protein P8C59_003651 [Phyllachora maydis]|uniref:Uncharacterized protein n=1 Tax=Phyllachora maydis TaxID=1825666 RepID=A0AAD9M9H6_9PEZI|nr:hypothetical protein P8C59_003651 [Phyllachora maydis]